MRMMGAGLCQRYGINVWGWILFLLLPVPGMRMFESVMRDTHPRKEV